LRFALILSLPIAAMISPALAQEQKPPQVEKPPISILGLEQVVALALEKSPVLGASSARENAAVANRSQASALPNPSLSVEAENIYGDYNGLSNAEITYGVSQLIELPGKRGSRVRIADAEKTKAHYNLDAVRLDLIRDVTIAYAELAAAQQAVAIFKEEYRLATEVRDSVGAKVQAGKEPPVQKNKAEIERSSSEIALERARRNLAAKRQALLSLMGGDTRDFVVSMKGLPPLTAPERLEEYRNRLSETPDTHLVSAEIDKARAGLTLEKANALPDPTVNVGLRDFRATNSQAFVVGLSIAFPVFNMNRAGIEKANHDLAAASLDQQSARLSFDAQLTGIYGDFINAYSEANALSKTVLPGAREAFSFARQGYEAGKFSYLEVLDAQRTLFDTHKQFNEAILDYHRQRAAIERITARHTDHGHQNAGEH